MTQPASPLEARLKRMIASAGPIDIATYMAHCLGDPEHGYYTRHKAIGAQGDFITAPEVSQMFGELIGICMLTIWHQTGRPAPFHLVELGPGRGTLMADMLRAVGSDPAASQALCIHLVEVSPVLREQQAQALAAHADNSPGTLHWHDDISTLPQAPLHIVANEFLDCLPTHQWVRHGKNWHERVVGLDEAGHLAFGLGPVRDMSEHQFGTAPQGAIREQSPAAEAILGTLAYHLAEHGGAALFIDYGHAQDGFGDTLQAMRSHAPADPLALPGEQDLTAHVNFAALTRAANEALDANSDMRVAPVITQGAFLLAMGLVERAGQLGAGKSEAEQDTIRDAVERLAAPEQMGDLFKVLALLPRQVTIPAFESVD